MIALGFIDVQRDFKNKDGALYVPGAEDIKQAVVDAYNSAVDVGISIFFTADDHLESDTELKRNGGPFVDHCMRNTDGQKFIIDNVDDYCPVFTKNGYDVFDFKTGNPNIRRWLQKEGITQVVLMGVALDYCVKAAAIGLHDMGIQVVVASELTRGIAEDTIKETLMEFHRRGIGYAPSWVFKVFFEENL